MEMNRHGNCRRIMISIACVAALLFPLSLTRAPGEAAEPSSPPPETLRLGEGMYREGILPSGKPMLTLVKGDVSVPGTTFACISCHLRSGLGAMDENVYTPPANGEKLYRPRYIVYKGIEQNQTDAQSSPLRPAYTDETLITVIRSGKDPAGHTLNEVMPRYILDDRDALILVNYLKSLSSQFSPGATDRALRFATVVTDEVSAEERKAMLSSWESYFKLINNQLNAFKTPRGARTRLMVENMLGSRELATRSMSLSQWVLKGPAETWRSQLEAYNRQEPVFALLGGITKGDWQPIHRFSEDNRIPCLFPNTDFPFISGRDWYTLYLSKGYYQEGESAARYLNGRDDLLRSRAVVQIVRDSREGRALSTGFQQTWSDLGHQAPMTVTLPEGKKLGKDALFQALPKGKPTVLMLWDDSSALSALESSADGQNRPEMVFLSSRYVGDSIWTLKEHIRDFTYITYPFAFSPYPPKAAMAMGKQKVQSDLKTALRQADAPLQDNIQKITTLTNALTQLLTLTLMDMKGSYYRDNFLDVIGTMMDQQYPLYGRISFGPGQRYASRGCYIVQLSQGDKPELVKKSDWEIH